jgi:hypothetical protein
MSNEKTLNAVDFLQWWFDKCPDGFICLRFIRKDGSAVEEFIKTSEITSSLMDKVN